jgi:raffinose/stachyose/melibiose transport system permease protein
MRLRRFINSALLVVMTAVYGLPIYMALLNTFKTQDQILKDPMGFPVPFTLDNIVQQLTRPDNLVLRGLMTSVEVTAISVVCLVILSSAIGHFLARHDSPVFRLLSLVFMAGMMIPPQIYLIPIVQIYRPLHMIGTFSGLLLVFVGGGLMSFAVFVYTGFIKNVPRELEEAAVIDGAGEFRMFWQCVFPLLRPATATVVIFLSLWIWNEFLIPLIIFGPSKGVTITTGIYLAFGQIFSINYGQMYAMMAIASLPMLVLFFVFQKEFIAGLVGGALKG